MICTDLSARFVAHLRARFASRRPNVTVHQSSRKSVLAGGPGVTSGGVDAGSVDVALCMDVYHHFEYPRTTMRSIAAALKPRGRLVLVDYDRDPSTMVQHSAQWALDHIRV